MGILTRDWISWLVNSMLRITNPSDHTCCLRFYTESTHIATKSPSMATFANNQEVFETETTLANTPNGLKHHQMFALSPETPITLHCDNRSLRVDFTIHSATRSWRVNRGTLCQRSKYFDIACNGPFQEATQDYPVLHDDDPDAVHDMLSYLMTNSYGPAFTASATAVDTHIAACDIADKYMLSGLLSSAVSEFTDCVEQMWIKGTAYDPDSAFAEVVERVYEDPRGVWEDALKAALRRTAVVRLVQVLPGDWLAQWGEVGGRDGEVDAPRFLADFWGSRSKLRGWWFKSGFPGMRFEEGLGGNGQEEGRVGRWVYEV